MSGLRLVGYVYRCTRCHADMTVVVGGTQAVMHKCDGRFRTVEFQPAPRSTWPAANGGSDDRRGDG